MSTVIVSQIDHALAQVTADKPTLQRISDELTFDAPGKDFDPRFRKGDWDGLIRLMDLRRRTFPIGLMDRVKTLAAEQGWELRSPPDRSTPVTLEEAREFISTLGIPEQYGSRDYQVDAFLRAVRTGRQLLVSPTSSGKSMIIYTVLRWYNLKTLIIVPTSGLVSQFEGDLADYGCPLDVKTIYDGKDDIDADVVISTWQSIYEQPAEWFDQFGLIIGDEAHLFSADSLTGIMMKARRSAHRFGFTGTLKGSKLHQLQLEGLFGPTYQVITTKELMDMGYVAKLDVQCVTLRHPPVARKTIDSMITEARKKGSRMTKGALSFLKETQFLYACEPRNRFIARMAAKLEGNVLVLFHTIEHGQRLYDMLVRDTDRRVHLIDGGVDGLERDEIRRLVDAADNDILLASIGTTSTGVSIRRLNHLIMASSFKGRIVNIQSIGRGLRLGHDKTKVTVYDLSDDLTLPEWPKNHSLKHAVQRREIYAEEQYDFTTFKVDLPY